MAVMLRKEPLEETIPSQEVMIRYEIALGIKLNVSRGREIGDQKKMLEIIRIAKTIAQGKVENE